jgi:hypothetical protein
MISRVGNILEGCKSEGIPLWIVENKKDFIKEEFSLLTGELVFLYSGGGMELVNSQIRTAFNPST